MSAFYDPRAVVSAIREVAVPAAAGGTVDVYLDFIAGVDRIAVYGLSPDAYAEESSELVEVRHIGNASATFHIDPKRTWARQAKAVVEWLASTPKASVSC
ncbi:hypothetical protein [Gordonia sp. MMO-8]|uniref:hypothetical protein n=1 Tax=Gordonia sp. MMO-8 TaxID=3127886 RepID=UPI003017029B